MRAGWTAAGGTVFAGVLVAAAVLVSGPPDKVDETPGPVASPEACVAAGKTYRPALDAICGYELLGRTRSWQRGSKGDWVSLAFLGTPSEPRPAAATSRTAKPKTPTITDMAGVWLPKEPMQRTERGPTRPERSPYLFRAGQIRLFTLELRPGPDPDASGTAAEVLAALEAPAGSEFVVENICTYRGELKAYRYREIPARSGSGAVLAVDPHEGRLRSLRLSEVLCDAVVPGGGQRVQTFPSRGWLPRRKVDRPREISTPEVNAYVNATHVEWATDAAVRSVSIPPLTRSFLHYYRPDVALGELNKVVVSIGPAVPGEGGLWFGLVFTDSPKAAGVGGIGWIDFATGALGMLRHPALIDCSIVALEVTPTVLRALTVSQMESAQGVCNGLVEIDRPTLRSRIALPPRDVSVVRWDDGELTPAERREAERYADKGPLLDRFAAWSWTAGPQPVQGGDLMTSMLAQGSLEEAWFREAASRGSTKYRQSCRLSTADVAVKCDSPLDDDLRPNRSWDASDAESAFKNSIADSVPRERKGGECERPWRAIRVHDFTLLPSGIELPAWWWDRQLAIVDREQEQARVEIRVGDSEEAWQWSIGNFRVGTACDRFGGTEFSRATVAFSAMRVDQEFVPGTVLSQDVRRGWMPRRTVKQYANDEALPPGLTFDPDSGTYTVKYECEGEEVAVNLEPATNIAPAIESHFHWDAGVVRYRYVVSLGSASKQPLQMFVFDPIGSVSDFLTAPSNETMRGQDAAGLQRYRDEMRAAAPPGWRAINFESKEGARVGWSREFGDTVAPFTAGQRQDGFGFSSNHLPGIHLAQFSGDNAVWSFYCEGPEGNEREVLDRNQHVPRVAAVPLIAIDDPFDASAVLGRLLRHAADLGDLKLLDEGSEQLTLGYLRAALRALEIGDAPEAQRQLAKFREWTRKRYPGIESGSWPAPAPPPTLLRRPVDQADRLFTDYDRILAARVLDFDVDFVAKRLTATAAAAAP